MVVRLLLAFAAVTVLVGAVARGSDARACDEARSDTLRLALPAVRGGEALGEKAAGEVAARVLDRCRGSDPLVAAAQALVRAGAPEAAGLLARTAVARDPENFQGHYALARVLDAEGKPAAAAAARARARRLNPLAPAPRGPRLDRDGRPLSG